MPEKQGLAGFCALTGEMIKVDNGQKESRIKPEVDVPPDYLPSGLPETHKIHTALVTPIAVRGATVVSWCGTTAPSRTSQPNPLSELVTLSSAARTSGPSR